MQTGESQLARFQRGTKTLSRDHSCDILVKNLAAFCPCSEKGHEAELESDGLTSLTEGNFQIV